MKPTHYLKTDIISTVSQQPYGKKGDRVTIVSEMGEHINTVIATGIAGKKFPVHVSKLSAEYVAPEAVEVIKPKTKKSRK
jgi:hypothetical protein